MHHPTDRRVDTTTFVNVSIKPWIAAYQSTVHEQDFHPLHSTVLIAKTTHEGRSEKLYLSTHFIYGYMASDIW